MLPDGMGDLLVYRLWMRTLTDRGLEAAYWPTAAADPMNLAMNYPPLVPYMLSLIGHLVKALSPAAWADDRLLDVLIRLPLCAMILLLAVVAYAETRRIAPHRADLACALIALNPALIFDTATWGQTDVLFALLAVLSLVALVRGRPELSWALIAAAALAKPLAYVLVPLVALETLKRFGPRRCVRSAFAALILFGWVLAPFAAAGRLGPGLRALRTQLDVNPYLSVNAHNVWWILGGGPSWIDARQGPWPFVTWSALALAVFASLVFATLVRLWRSEEPQAVYLASASTAFGFFVLSTHMHENHLFLVVPLLGLCAAWVRPARLLMAGLSVTLLANMLLHDPYLTHLARPHIPGPHVLAPASPAPEDDTVAWYAARGMPWIAEEIRGEASVVGLMATLVNAQANLLLFAAWLLATYRRRSFDDASSLVPPRLAPAVTATAALFVAVTTGLFLSHVLRLPR